MSDEAKAGLDRRGFIAGTIASVAASAAIVGSTAVANAQGATAPAVGSTRLAPQGTVYTGDIIDGKKVISALNVSDLQPGKHLFYFQGVEMPTGQHWFVSVIVAKGAKPGKRILLSSGVHGDEMSSVYALQAVMNQLNPAEMAGTVIAVPDVSRPALEGMARRWPNSGLGINLIDMNREWPGNEDGASATSRHAGLLFN